MCDVSGKLVAWIDRELPAAEAAEVEKHLETCAGCRHEVDAYKRSSAEFDAYCDEVIAVQAHPAVPRWVPAASVAGVAAALAALFLLWPRPHVEPVMQAMHPAASVEEPVLAGSAASEAAIPVHKSHQIPARSIAPSAPRVEPAQAVQAAMAQREAAYVFPSEPMIQIAIPASEMFPPGAVPEGVDFVADLSVATDGSVEGLRFRPRPAGF